MAARALPTGPLEFTSVRVFGQRGDDLSPAETVPNAQAAEALLNRLLHYIETDRKSLRINVQYGNAAYTQLYNVFSDPRLKGKLNLTYLTFGCGRQPKETDAKLARLIMEACASGCEITLDLSYLKFTPLFCEALGNSATRLHYRYFRILDGSCVSMPHLERAIANMKTLDTIAFHGADFATNSTVLETISTFEHLERFRITRAQQFNQTTANGCANVLRRCKRLQEFRIVGVRPWTHDNLQVLAEALKDASKLNCFDVHDNAPLSRENLLLLAQSASNCPNLLELKFEPMQLTSYDSQPPGAQRVEVIMQMRDILYAHPNIQVLGSVSHALYATVAEEERRQFALLEEWLEIRGSKRLTVTLFMIILCKQQKLDSLFVRRLHNLI